MARLGVDGGAVFRQWAGAANAPVRADGANPAPFGLDFEQGKDEVLKSTLRTHFAKGWSEDVGQMMIDAIAAGVIPKDGRSAAGCLTRSSWDQPDWKSLESTYMVHSNKGILDRHHRRNMKTLSLSQQSREERWVKCFKQWEHGAGVDDQTIVASTDFSILPAGWQLDGRPMPHGALPNPKATGEMYKESLQRKAMDNAETFHKRREAEMVGPLVMSLFEQEEDPVSSAKVGPTQIRAEARKAWADSVGKAGTVNQSVKRSLPSRKEERNSQAGRSSTRASTPRAATPRQPLQAASRAVTPRPSSAAEFEFEGPFTARPGSRMAYSEASESAGGRGAALHPVPFWQAADGFKKAGNIHYGAGSSTAASSGVASPSSYRGQKKSVEERLKAIHGFNAKMAKPRSGRANSDSFSF